MQKEKSIGRNILIVVLILVTIASICAGLFAWAKYQTTINGTATGETAKWSFKVSDGNTSTQEIEFPMTRKDNNTSVATGKIAPGTYGELEIGIDATGTETALTYTIEGELTNLPTNIKFYSDEERTLELTIMENKFTKGGYMKLNEIGVRTEKIYWEWPFETKTKPSITEEKLASLGIDKNEFDAVISANKFTEANDMLDTAETNNQVSMTLSVTGKQLNGNPVLADLVQVGDYVNYDASSNGIETFTSSNCLAGSSINGTFSSQDIEKWRVLSIDRENGIVKLMSADPTTNIVTLTGKDGYKNGKEVLNNIGAIYGHGKGAIEGKSIDLESIEQYSNFDKTTFINNGYAVGETKTYKSKIFIMDDGTEIEATEANPITIEQTSYYYATKKYFNNNSIFNMIFRTSTDITIDAPKFWIATNCIGLNSSYCSYYLHNAANGWIGTGYVYNNAVDSKSSNGAVSVVVVLETNIKTSGQDENGAWNIIAN